MLTEVTALTGPIHFGGHDLYHWTTDFTLSQVPITTPGLYFCYTRGDGAYWGGVAHYRWKEVNGELPTLFTFPHGGVTCTIQRVLNQDEDLLVAAWNCRGPITDEVLVTYSF
jgi:hypothetical protein